MNGDIPANTVLGIMVKYLFTGKKFLVKLIPCACLTSEYQFDFKTSAQVRRMWRKGIGMHQRQQQSQPILLWPVSKHNQRDASQMCPI